MLIYRAKGGSKLAGHYTNFLNRQVAVVAHVGSTRAKILYKKTMTRIGAWKHRQSELSREGVDRVILSQEDGLVPGDSGQL